MNKLKLAYLVTHPIQYQAPLLRLIAAELDIDLTVFFGTDFTARTFTAEEFGQTIPGTCRCSTATRNDASHAYHNAFESTFSAWNTFIDNRADSSDYGFWLGYSRGNVVRGNIILGSRTAAIAIEHGGENTLSENTIIGGQDGIRLFARNTDDEPSTDYRIDDNTIARVSRGLVLERTTRARIRGNLLDGVEDGLVVDGAGSGTLVSGNVFLSARRWLIDAADLMPAATSGGPGTSPPPSARCAAG